jgi:hypothetical protein
LRAVTADDGSLRFTGATGLLAGAGVVPSNYAFGQAAGLVGYGARELRKLNDRPDLVVSILNHLADKRGEEVKAMVVDPVSTDLDSIEPATEPATLAALTGPDYGRIWDVDVARAAQTIIDRTEGRFFSPIDWGKEKRALFAGDRDVFLFFCDGGSIVDGGGSRDQLHRGFYMWNSEVGTRSMGISTFLFRAVCGNFGIWGAEDVRVVKIRHTSGGPERFITEAVPALNEFVNMTAKPLEARIKAAKAFALPATPDKFAEFFKARGFNGAEVRRAIQFADSEEGQHGSLWDMYNGFTAMARHLAYADAKLDLETRAGKLLDRLDV